MASYVEAIQKDLIELREAYEQKCKDYEELYEENCSLEREVSELNSQIENTFHIDIDYIDTIIEFTQEPFKEQLKLFYGLCTSKDRFSSKSSYEEMINKQRNIVYRLACVLAYFDELDTALSQVAIYEKNLFIDEIGSKFKFPNSYVYI